MDALRRIHAALAVGAVVVDTQPVSPWPAVTTTGAELGALDMRGWADIVAAVDEQVERVVAAGLFASETRPDFTVADTFESGPGVLDTVASWQGTSVPAELRERLAAHAGRVRVEQQVRMRLLRAR